MKLRDACVFIVDCEHKTAPLDSDGQYLSIRTPNLGRGSLILDGVNRVSAEVYEKWTKRGKPRAGDLIMAREAPVGNVAVIPNNLNVCLGQRTVLIRPDPVKADSRFLCYYLLSDFVQNQIHGESTGATVAHLNMSDIRDIILGDLPKIAKQQRIASILSAYDELIEVNNQRIKLLEETARELYKEWFVRMRFPGYKKAKFVKGIPEGWQIDRIDSLYTTSSGGTPAREKEEYYQNGIYNWVKTGELVDSFIFETDEKISDLGLKKSSAKLFPPYTVIFAMYGNTIGQLGITTQACSTNQACCALIPKTKEFDFEFIFLTLLQNRETIISFGMGAAQQNVNQDELRKFKILKPNSSLALRFKELINPMFKQIENLQQQNFHLRQIRDRLLPRLISGKLQVKEKSLATSKRRALANAG